MQLLDIHGNSAMAPRTTSSQMYCAQCWRWPERRLAPRSRCRGRIARLRPGWAAASAPPSRTACSAAWASACGRSSSRTGTGALRGPTVGFNTRSVKVTLKSAQSQFLPRMLRWDSTYRAKAKNGPVVTHGASYCPECASVTQSPGRVWYWAQVPHLRLRGRRPRRRSRCRSWRHATGRCCCSRGPRWRGW